MEPITLTLLGFPLSIFANITYDQAKKIKERLGGKVSLEKLYLDSFYKSIDTHKQNYDEFARQVTNKFKKAIRKDEEKFLRIICDERYFSFTNFTKSDYIEKISENIIQEYDLHSNYPKVVKQILEDCFSYYINSFFNLINEKDGIKTILIECLKLDQIIDLLKKIDQQLIKKDEFDELRRIVFESYTQDDRLYQKTIKDYDNYINNKFKFLELRGFSPKIAGKEVQMELDDIFVPLSINKQTDLVPNILDENLELGEDKNTFKSIEILNHRTLVILGDPGSGKSTLLKYLSTLISTLRDSEHILKNIVPVLFRLSDYSDYYKKYKKSIYEFITNHIDIQYQDIYKESFEYSNLLILMDGLDEITETSLRLKVTEQVTDLIARYPNNRYFVTSRIVGYQEAKLGPTFSHYKLLSFREEEIELFANQWYKSIADHTDKDYEHADLLADTLFNSIKRNPSVLKLATNPLLMTIIAMIHYQGKKLPSKRIELYEISTDTFLEHWVHLRISDESQLKDKSEILEILAPIAFEIHKSKSNALIEENEFKDIFLKVYQEIHTNSTSSEAKTSCREFIKFIRQQTGFIYEKGVDDQGNRFYGFMHLTFEEYLSSIEFVSLWSEEELDLKDYIFQSRWTEIIRLSASQIRLSFKGKAGRTQTSKFIKDILEVDDNFPDAFRPLQLVCLIVADDIAINDSIFNEILDKIFYILSNFKYQSLINSFIEVFRELLLSEKQKFIIERIIKSLNTDNDLLYDNLVKVLMHNHEIPEIRKILIEQIQNTSKQKRIFYLFIYNESLLRDEFFKPLFFDYLDSLSPSSISKNDLRLIRNYLLSTTGIRFFSGLNDTKANLIKSTLKSFAKNKHYNTVLKIFLEVILSDISEISIHLLDEIKSFTRNDFLNKLLISIKSKKESILENRSSSSTMWVSLKNYDGVLKGYRDNLRLYLWDKKFETFHVFNFEETKYNHFLEKMQCMLSSEEIGQLEFSILYINGPEGTELDLERFIKYSATDNTRLLDFFGWEDFPLLNIHKEPQILSEVILKHPLRYLSNGSPIKRKYKEKVELTEPDNKEILAPIRLISLQRAKLAYNQELIEESLEFYQSCSSDLKEGVFEILYRVLNPINTADNNV
ncbi:NACHT domain-containing protein [Maribellus sp. YY47]|uniref:NACHT domain-containing protein n=1 Tax=Maribellus sp. YY47 TaxID=2929486 RepID=UPI00200172A6|nr:NACHT domain-containing protein [Maribellus sp. YY47]MCK3684231.1 NACHT domain-containing protein [Maribellus sp. YY47]